MALLEEVFKVSGVPTITFVEPTDYDALKVSIRTPGRCCVIEGPSGIGKTSSVIRILQDLKVEREALQLSGRKVSDVALIEALPTMQDIGIVIIDDFHRLPVPTKGAIAHFMKTLADEEHERSKLVLIGINKAGDHLVTFGHDIGLRVDVFKMEANPDNKIEELIGKGERALNVVFSDKDNFVARSIGSFQIAQVLCHSQCIKNKIAETVAAKSELNTSVEVVVDYVIQDLRRIFSGPTISFARGSKLRREGRAPYLHVLRWLAEQPDWSLDLRQAIRVRPEHRGSVGQVVEKGYLSTLLSDKSGMLGEFFHFDAETSVISVEDPRLIFYLKNLNWRAFAREVGFSSQDFKGRYDFALSFAGEDRAIARRLCELLSAREISVFYDENEQHRILAENIEDYLAPIYRTEAAYVVPILSKHFPRKIWTKFESDNFKNRFGQRAVISIRFTDAPEGFFSLSSGYGGLPLDPMKEVEPQLLAIVDMLAKRLAEDREEPVEIAATGSIAGAETAISPAILRGDLFVSD